MKRFRVGKSVAIGGSIALAVGLLVSLGMLLSGEGRTLRLGIQLWAVPLVLAAIVVVGVLLNDWYRKQLAKVEMTERLAAEDESRKRHRSFVARLDHELKNPITALHMALPDVENPALAQAIRSQLDRLASLISELRKISDIEDYQLAIEAVELPEIIQEVLETLRVSNREVFLGFPKARPLPPVAADRDLLFLALYNVVNNAVKYSIPGATIEFRAFVDAKNVVLEVSDSGRGIPADEVDQVWNELVRGRSAYDVAGSGLGLPMVAAVLRRLGGDCTLSSVEGQGTTVRLQLPATAAYLNQISNYH